MGWKTENKLAVERSCCTCRNAAKETTAAAKKIRDSTPAASTAGSRKYCTGRGYTKSLPLTPCTIKR